jgi:hypothetical protein
VPNLLCAGENGQYATYRRGLRGKNRLVFVWPLMVRTRRARDCASCAWLTEPFGQYGDVHLRAGRMRRSMWVGNALRFFKPPEGHRPPAPAPCPRRQRPRRASQARTWSTPSSTSAHPIWTFRPLPHEADYENRYTGAQRKRRKKIRKHLEEFGPVSVQAPVAGQSVRHRHHHGASRKKTNGWLSAAASTSVLGCPGTSGIPEDALPVPFHRDWTWS